MAETYGWLVHRLGEDVARAFRGLVAEMQGLRLLAADARHHEAVARKLDRHRGRKLTYVDASSLVWMAERGISLVWSGDQDLALEGARVVPGRPLR